MKNLLDLLATEQETKRTELFTVTEYLEICKKDPMAYATSAERMLAAIGEPNLVDTHDDPRLSRIFHNKTIKQYPAFSDFYGMEESIEKIVGYFRHAAQGLEEKKQILYLLGPVGGGKSSLAERLKLLMEKFPIYVLADHDGKISPALEPALGLFSKEKYGKIMEDEFGIPRRYFSDILSPWAIKRLEEYKNDKTAFRVIKTTPSILRQLGIVKTEPGDDNNQDISNLVGKTNIRMLEHFDQDDTDSYSYSGALCKGNQGIVEFVEMFKAPIKMLHPLLTATQEGNYIGTEGLSAIPFNGTVLAHSNESEWQAFKNNKSNEAFIDRVYTVKVPYCLRISEEKHIYEKMLSDSSLNEAPCAGETLDILAKFSVLTRIYEHENSNIFSKMRVYDGEAIKDTDPRAKSLQEYRDVAGVDEGMSGISTRFAFKILSKTYNFDPTEIAADPVHLMFILEEAIKQEQFAPEKEAKYTNFIKEYLAPKYAEQLSNEIQKAYLESYSDYGQNIFSRYLEYADAWIQDIDYKDPDTGNLYDRTVLNDELEKIEKPAGISNPKDFRNEVVNFCIRAKAKNEGKDIKWTSYEKLREVIEHKMFANTEELLPIISFTTKSNSDDQKKHEEFVQRMVARGYTPKQVRVLVEWHMRTKKST